MIVIIWKFGVSERDRRSIYQGELLRDLTGGSVPEIISFISSYNSTEISNMNDDEKREKILDVASGKSVHSNFDLQYWEFNTSCRSLVGLALTSSFLESRGLKTEAELRQMSFLHQYDVLVLQMVNLYHVDEDLMRNLTVVELVMK